MSDFVSEELSEEHELREFASGRPELDAWLREHARHAQAMRTARTFIWLRDGEVCGYFSLAAHLLRRSELPSRIGRGSPEVIPAVLLARLALHEKLHGKGLGAELLVDALSRAAAASRLVAARVVVVDAIDEPAARFYEHHGFIRIRGTSYRLVQKMSDIAAALK